MQPDNAEHSLATPSLSRKNSKPIMEKRRRARINSSLAELKSILLEVLKKEGTRHNKMEKADILEMTVRHLRQIQRNQFAAAACVDAGIVNKYQTGFKECAEEVSRYLSSVEGINTDTRVRLLNHLANSISTIGHCVAHAQNTGPITAHVRPIQSSVPKQQESVTNGSSTKSTNEINNNSVPPAIQHTANVNNSSTNLSNPGSIGVVSQKLSGGDVAFVIPSNILASGHVPGYVIPIYASTSIAPAQAGAQATSPPTEVNPNISLVPHTTIVPSLNPRLQEAVSTQSTVNLVNNIHNPKSSPILVLPTKARTPPGVAQIATVRLGDDKNEVKIHVPNLADRVRANAQENDDMWRPW